MAFRANEARNYGEERALNYLVSRHIESTERGRSRNKVLEIIDEYGPVIDSYPCWHPLVSSHDRHNPVTTPGEICGYKELDHTVYMAKGFITCPYNDGQKVIDAVEDLPFYLLDHVAIIEAERLDVQLYHSMTTPILVSCQWNRRLSMDGMIPKSLAVPLILEREIPCWTWADCAETWETMRPFFLGCPHGKRSSLFISQETGQVIKKIWNALINTGMFGPIRVD